MMVYKIRHVTRFRYSAPIVESVTEARVQPATNETQRCINFRFHVRPNAQISAYQDYLGNLVHHFNIPGAHREVTITAESEVQKSPSAFLPINLEAADWSQIDQLTVDGAHWEMLLPSYATERTNLLDALAEQLKVERRSDPLSLLHEINNALYQTFAYDAQSTRVDSPIDDALEKRSGVCQDFTHIMLALVRNYLRIPCRYVSGYLYHRRADRSSAGATHAWVEAFLPGLGWVGFDPTNNILAGDRHIQVGIGRDYHDVPPTRGVFKGSASSELSVTVHVRHTEEVNSEPIDDSSEPPYLVTQQELQEQYNQTLLELMQMQQQQQQQQ